MPLDTANRLYLRAALWIIPTAALLVHVSVHVCGAAHVLVVIKHSVAQLAALKSGAE